MCVVCGSFGQGAEGRLLACSQCGQCYHPFCVNVKCGATSPGLRCDWQNNYTQCSPCASMASCPMCTRSYREDELIVQCRHCDRWIHACCQGLNTDKDVENAADDGFDCTMCRMHALPSQGKTPDLAHTR
ncbi:unnamed protein product [Coregonus sp. 'balchen']|nr:unnamed protein product [Coregonus sp. 'balchen']